LNGAKLRWRSKGTCLGLVSTQGGSTQWTPLIFLTERKIALRGRALRRARPRRLVDEGRRWRGRAGRRYRQMRRPGVAIPPRAACSATPMPGEGVCELLRIPQRKGCGLRSPAYKGMHRVHTHQRSACRAGAPFKHVVAAYALRRCYARHDQRGTS
jgi:hypothetical protein